MRPQRDPRRSMPRRRAVASRGLTLIEVLIVVALIALLSGAVVLGAGSLYGSRQRGAATMIVAGVRLGMARANTSGHPVRMVFDLDRGRVHLEEASGRTALRRSTKDKEKDKKKASEGEDPAADPEAAVSQDATRIMQGVSTAEPEFRPVKQFGFDGDEPEGGRDIGKGVEFRQVQTEHDEEPVTEGKAYLYFWPRGGTERASIQVRKQGSTEGLTVLVSALTGRARMERGNVDLPEPRGDDEFSEREEE